jgi:hypothetical protein
MREQRRLRFGSVFLFHRLDAGYRPAVTGNDVTLSLPHAAQGTSENLRLASAAEMVFCMSAKVVVLTTFMRGQPSRSVLAGFQFENRLAKFLLTGLLSPLLFITWPLTWTQMGIASPGILELDHAPLSQHGLRSRAPIGH